MRVRRAVQQHLFLHLRVYRWILWNIWRSIFCACVSSFYSLDYICLHSVFLCMTCYICLDNTGTLLKKTCGCNMLVHKKCFMQELQNKKLFCSVCQQPYDCTLMHHWPTVLCRVFFFVFLFVDELIILLRIRLSPLIIVTTLYVNACIGASMFMALERTSICVHVVHPSLLPSSNV